MNFSQLKLLLKVSFKGGQPRNTATRSFNTGDLASALGSRRCSERSDWPPRTLKPQKQNSKCLQMGQCFFFFFSLLNHTGKRGLLQWEEQIVCALPLWGLCTQNTGGSPWIRLMGFLLSCFLFKNNQTLQKVPKKKIFQKPRQKQSIYKRGIQKNHKCISSKQNARLPS